jgi:hypothetical protein
MARWDVAVVGDARLAVERIAAASPSRQVAEKPFHSAEASALITAFHPEQDFQLANTADRNLVVDGGNFLGVVPISGP